ncbi:Fungalysin metallopeptidase-domain-containing protein [Irpex rosettiformis]|uniref:Fungalysin metallopeptidase-domain-containing protein n=1 Tax=Irpex rosettiformis TaxID=378272 RepID=A0ACB8U3F5_9APHY|nr:Fungalysin metallopeptidase-domain-containing protein [Irpex rosettiformis]
MNFALFLLLTPFIITFILAAPLQSANSFKLSTHRTHRISRDLILHSYHPISSFQTFPNGIDHPLSKRADASLQESAIAFVQHRLKLKPRSAHLYSSFEGSTARHAYIRQQINNITVANAVANVAFNKDNKVIAFGSSFISNANSPSSTPTVSMQDAIQIAEERLGGTYDRTIYPAPVLQYIAKEDGELALTHAFYVTNDTSGIYYEAFVDAHSRELISVTDFVAQATYRVLPVEKEVLTEGFEDLTDPWDILASPSEWHDDGRTLSNSTAGNNVITFQSIQSNPGLPSSNNLQFLYTQDPSKDPTVSVNLNAALVNAFYLVNTVHDFAYRYGFTEPAFNFQTDNFDKGGKGNDRITTSVQMSPGTDNAFFATMADGINGQLRLYIFDFTSPRRDGALENDVVVHEATHGITNRLVGGGTASCLQTLEAGGLGEGWSDALADWVHQTSSSIEDFVVGPYVSNDPAGIRSYPYSTNNITNPLTYSSVASRNEVHDIGEAWANILHNVLAALVNVHGFATDARTNPSSSAGNVIFMHLFMDHLPLLPCNPTFVNARDAWIQADANRYQGSNKCTLWNVFASRGMGDEAANYTNDFTVPQGC